MQLDPRILGGELPLRRLPAAVPALRPGRHLPLDGILVLQAAVQVPAVQRAELVFRHFHPAAVPGCEDELQPARQARRLRRRERLVQRGAGVGAEVVHHQRDPLGLGEVLLHQPAHTLESLAPVVRRIEHGETDALGVIHELLSGELAFRETRRAGVAPATARLTPPKTLEGFDFGFQPSLDRHRVLAPAQFEFIDRAETVHFPGPPGTGKSHPAPALGVAAEAGRSVYRTSLAEIVDPLAAARRADRLDDKLR